MSDYLISLIRTWVPVGIGSALAWLATFGVDLDADTQAGLVVTLTAVVIAVYYAVVRKLEQRWPAIGRVLLGLGAAKTPVYASPAATVRVDGVLRQQPGA
jgi:uncharacterized membrane protein (DUF441 family)